MPRVHGIVRAFRNPLWGALLYGIVFWLLVSPGQAVDYLRYPNGNDWGALAVLLSLLAFASLNFRFFDSSPPAQVADTKNWSLWARVLPGLLIVLVLAYWHYRYSAQIIDSPISIKQADMLPLMLDGFKDLDALRSPYHPHQLEWVLKNYYLPATFLPYYIVYKLGWDIRWVTILCLDGVGLGLLYILRGPKSGAWGMLLAAVCWSGLYSVFALFVLDRSLVRIIHLGPYWLYICLLLVAVVRQNHIWAIIWATCSLLSREPALFLVSPLLVVYGKLYPSATRKAVGLAFVAGFVTYLPFFIDNPRFYLGNLEQYSSLGFYLQWYQDRFIGFSALFSQLGVAGVRWPMLLVLQSGLLWVVWHRTQRENVLHITAAAFCSITLFYLFALITWEYAFVPSIIALSVWMLFAVREWLNSPPKAVFTNLP